MKTQPSRFSPSRVFRTATIAAVLLGVLSAHAQTTGVTVSSSSNRAATREFGFMYTLFTMPTITARNVEFPGIGTFDAVMDFDDVDMASIAFGYNVNDHFNVNGDVGYGEGSYTGTWGTRELRGRGSMWNVRAAVDYNFLTGPITPYVSAGIGYNAYDTGIPTGDVDFFCWWDYWWGTYVCSADVETYRTSEFTWSAGAGVRWDFNESIFGKVAYTATWMEVGTQGVDVYPEYQILVGWKY